jgi:hypothetical protein
VDGVQKIMNFISVLPPAKAEVQSLTSKGARSLAEGSTLPPNL